MMKMNKNISYITCHIIYNNVKLCIQLFNIFIQNFNKIAFASLLKFGTRRSQQVTSIICASVCFLNITCVSIKISKAIRAHITAFGIFCIDH